MQEVTNVSSDVIKSLADVIHPVTPTCDGQTDRRTHDDSIYHAGVALRGKNGA